MRNAWYVGQPLNNDLIMFGCFYLFIRWKLKVEAFQLLGLGIWCLVLGCHGHVHAEDVPRV